MGRYDPLRAHLVEANAKGQYRVEMTFNEIERLVGGLPASARKYDAWWSNEQDGQHVQARAWLDAGYTVTNVDLNAARTRFDLARRAERPAPRRLRPL